MDFNAFSISPEVTEALETNKDFSVLLRPDNHVGLISSDISTSGVKNYLAEFIEDRPAPPKEQTDEAKSS